MQLTRHESGASFGEAAETFLLKAEAENGLMLGLIGSLSERAETDETKPVLASVAVAGHTVACALRTPPFPIVVTRAPDEALGSLARKFAELDAGAPGVLGPREAALEFSTHWSAATGRGHEVIMQQGIYSLEQMDLQVPDAPGLFRPATPDDIDLISGWIAEFHTEASSGIKSDPRVAAEQGVEAASIFVWDDARPVALAGTAGPTRHGIRVNLVYTPPEMRGKGYASALVGRLSQKLLTGGKDFCFLYTDLTNPTPNKIYQRLGYRLACEGVGINFE